MKHTVSNTSLTNILGCISKKHHQPTMANYQPTKFHRYLVRTKQQSIPQMPGLFITTIISHESISNLFISRSYYSTTCATPLTKVLYCFKQQGLNDGCVRKLLQIRETVVIVIFMLYEKTDEKIHIQDENAQIKKTSYISVLLGHYCDILILVKMLFFTNQHNAKLVA